MVIKKRSKTRTEVVHAAEVRAREAMDQVFGRDVQSSIFDVARNCGTREAGRALHGLVLMLAVRWRNLPTDLAGVCADAVFTFAEAFASRRGEWEVEEGHGKGRRDER